MAVPPFDEQILAARVLDVDCIVKRGKAAAFVLSLDCPYLTLIHFTAHLGSNQVKQRKRVKKGLPKSKLRLAVSLVGGSGRQRVDVEIGFVSPLEANAIVAIADAPGIVPSVGDTLEFAIARDC